ncbi:hypothetical protein HBH25_01700 [Pseudomonas sp. hsmgli-8]|uniref:Uncharacterized protein n=1 Tax=Pseudomonas quercus TaxID=2722792 RepID=A0ABX0Y9H6_9PSED|nr:hypothetical protein [Pseudomonas sp. LY10J]NJO99581.1 hypothetical protein [Pseudomonas quercus]
MAIEGNDPQRHVTDQAPERIEPDLTPAPGTPRTYASASGNHADASGDKGDLGFDPDSPDLADPQVDPTHPAKPPAAPDVGKDKRAEGDSYPPYDQGKQ